ncbi:MAG: hydantoinase/oxoprolinase family protein, partial [Alphaproteobacteria bacterium]|nr:hydantoinase/oxoprolinase family protein [Alphaproteobacteria bacterium]
RAPLDRNGDEVAPLDHAQVREALALFKARGVEAVAICFMNSYANPSHERAAARIVEAEFPEAYLTVSSDLLPSIRFYERVSTTALNAYIGPILDRYLEQLSARLGAGGFQGVLLIMQSNGGVMSPEVARKKAALTLLSGPAGGPVAGLAYASVHGLAKAIVVDMGGTSFEAALVIDDPVMVNEGQIDRLRIALPMLAINTIGAGGGSIGWLDEGGLLRVGPQSAGADPGPVSYGKGGTLPTITDANLVLGYLNADFFAGGKMQLDAEAARLAIESHIAKPLDLSVGQAAAGMYRVACNNMAQGVRAVTIARGRDPREFPMVVAGGAGPIHSCLICNELEIPFQIVPRESSILCAVGMLMGDLKHDFVRTFVSPLKSIDWDRLRAIFDEMKAEGAGMLVDEGIDPEDQDFHLKFDCRYLKQYHEVSFVVPDAAVENGDVEIVANAFHGEHNRLYGYSLEEQEVPVEIINVRVQALGRTEKPVLQEYDRVDADPSAALKGERPVYIPENKDFETIPIYDGHQLNYGHRIPGPALIEEVTTAIFVSTSFDCIVDRLGSFVLYQKGRDELVEATLKGETI